MAGTFTPIVGPGGDATTDPFVGKIVLWTATFDFGLVDTSGLEDEGWTTCSPTVVSCAGSVLVEVTQEDAPLPQSIFNATAGVQQFEDAEFALNLDDTRSFTFSAQVGNVDLTRPYEGRMDMTVNFRSSGEISVVGWA